MKNQPYFQYDKKNKINKIIIPRKNAHLSKGIYLGDTSILKQFDNSFKDFSIPMFQSKKGQMIFVGIGIAVMVFLTVIAMIPALKDGITTARDVDNLDCSNSSISVGTQATCIVVDFWLFYFVISGVGAGLAYITGIALYNRIRTQ